MSRILILQRETTNSRDYKFYSPIEEEYYNWIYDMFIGRKANEYITYHKLMYYLFRKEFTFYIPRDDNRYNDGLSLRHKFALRTGNEEAMLDLNGPCSVLEMICALAIRIEDIVEDSDYGDRTAQWFWNMLTSLGTTYDDSCYDEEDVIFKINRFLDRTYAPSGKGGLFYVPSYPGDMANIEIWYQAMAYINTLV